MADAPGHRLGQIVGDALEAALQPILQRVADKHSLYLDKKGYREARGGKKLTWTDALGNKHDLDYVLERGGTDEELGVPVAFVETAWRRYTKHSKNKAQEIQGALLPLLETHAQSKPFAGAVVAGVFTEASLEQLRSNGFEVLYIEYNEIIEVFSEFHIDLAYDERTPDEHLRAQIETYESLDDDRLEEIGEALRRTAPAGFTTFGKALDRVLSRKVKSVSVIALHGEAVDCETVEAAIDFVREYAAAGYRTYEEVDFARFEVILRYSNGDRVTADFGEAEDATAFLVTFL